MLHARFGQVKWTLRHMCTYKMSSDRNENDMSILDADYHPEARADQLFTRIKKVGEFISQ